MAALPLPIEIFGSDGLEMILIVVSFCTAGSIPSDTGTHEPEHNRMIKSRLDGHVDVNVSETEGEASSYASTLRI